MGLGKQGKRKARRRSVIMSPEHMAGQPTWSRPPEDEWAHDNHSFFAPPDSSLDENRIKISLVQHHFNWTLIEFSILHQTKYRGRWVDVVEADSCHDTDAHLHRYSKRTGTRIGDPEMIMPITCIEDVDEAYGVTYGQVIDCWAKNLERWKHA